MSSEDRLLSALEAVLMVAEEPVLAGDIAAALSVPTYLVEQALTELQEEYAGANGERPRGFELRSIGGGWRFYSSPEWATLVGKFVVGQSSAQLSQAALETLAIVAYRQPVTRAQIAGIRGVNVDSVVRGLQSRGLIDEVGVTQTGANTYGTTSTFLERMGMSSIDELVPLAPMLPDADSIESLTIEVEEHL